MPRPTALTVLGRGADAWNAWRARNQTIVPDLSPLDLSEMVLSRHDLSRVNFHQARLRESSLSGASLHRAVLVEANLFKVTFDRADLSWADLRRAHAPSAGFSRADLRWADLSGADLRDADFRAARIGWTIFGANDLSSVTGLETVRHDGPSTIGIDTLYRSGGRIPASFLRGAGVPEELITHAQDLAKRPVRYRSCFLSYSRKDNRFVERLHTDLQNAGLVCWYDQRDLKVGEEFPTSIEEAVRSFDAVLVVLSHDSLASEWVAREVEAAAQPADGGKQPLILPMTLDDAVLTTERPWAVGLRLNLHIASFRNYARGRIYERVRGDN
jgi:uncharacterized protein YjbI with pentapeptide repeats